MKAKYINNRPVAFSSPENICVGDIIEQNNPPRGVNYWEVLSIEKTDIKVKYTVKMLSGSAFTGSIYNVYFDFKYPEKKLSTHWFYNKTISARCEEKM